MRLRRMAASAPAEDRVDRDLGGGFRRTHQPVEERASVQTELDDQHHAPTTGTPPMKLVAALARSLHADLPSELRHIERAVATGTRDAARRLKNALRRQVGSAGLGQRVANSWRDRHYPSRELDAATLVYTKAPQIVRVQ
jgi:Family of unknown function (DUF6441)